MSASIFASLDESSSGESFDSADVERVMTEVRPERTEAAKKLLKALRDKKRAAARKAALEKQNWSRPPRTLGELVSANFEKLFANTDHEIEIETRAEVRVLVAEYCESRSWGASFVASGPRHPVTGVLPATKSTVFCAVCPKQRCSFNSKWEYDAEEGEPVQLIPFEKGQASGGRRLSRRTPSTAAGWSTASTSRPLKSAVLGIARTRRSNSRVPSPRQTEPLRSH
jgi:hypothetical protein